MARKKVFASWRTLSTRFTVKYVLVSEDGSTELKFLSTKIQIPLEGIDPLPESK